MDKHDEQFESYLRQFRLKKVSPLPEIALVQRQSRLRWFLAAAAAFLVAGVISTVYFRSIANPVGAKVTIEASGSPSLYTVGEVVAAGDAIRSNSAVGLLLALEDGSRVEMHSQSELKLESAEDGIRVRLNDGSIVVTAAKQSAGHHLYVQTRDAVVSVVGTVFLVNAELSGTRVAVVEGEVHVQQGAELRKLLPGEQTATNSSIALKPVADEISWSRSAARYVALLQQPSEVAPPSSTPVVAAQAGGVPDVNSNGAAGPSITGSATSLLPFKVQANYLKVTADQVRTLITVQVMTRDLAFRDEGGKQVAKAEITGSIFRADNRRLAPFTQSAVVEFPTLNALKAGLDQPYLYQETQYLTPGKYKLHLTVEDKNSQGIGVQDILLTVPRIPDQILQASSMILASSIADLPKQTVGVDPFALGDKKVKPNVTGVFRQDQSLNVWQEIYGLTEDLSTRKTSAAFDMTISQNNLVVKRSASTSTQSRYTSSVPLSEFAPGAYDVQIKVSDNVAKASLVSTGRFTVVRAPGQAAPIQITSGKQVFDRWCTSCHNADIAMRMGSIGTQFTASDRVSLASTQAVMLQLLNKGFTEKHPDVVIAQSKISMLLRKEADTKNGYSSFVLSHLSKFGGIIGGAGFPALVEYLFEEAGKREEPQATSVPQDRPVTPPVQPNEREKKKEDPDAAGARILNTACTTCHDLEAVTRQANDRKTWEGVVSGMVGYGADVKDAELPVLLDYLFKHYGPKDAPKPAAPAPPRPPQ